MDNGKYQIFVSHAHNDLRVVQTIRRILNDAFEGHLKLYLAEEDILSGRKWKNEIIKHLEICDAIICLVTPEFINSPWLYLEWSPFWVRNKFTYLLLTPQITKELLIEPMRDVQCIDIENMDKVKDFFHALRDDTEFKQPIPFHYAELFVKDVISAEKEQLTEQFEHYRHNISSLPDSDVEKDRIALFFYEKHETKIFQQIISHIRSDQRKHEIAVKFLRNGDLLAVELMLDYLTSAEYLGYLAIEFINRNLFDSKQLKDIIDILCSTNQAELRKIAIYLAKLGHHSTPLFQNVCGLITNMAEFKKVPIFFIENNNIQFAGFQELLKKICDTNRSELRQVAIEFIKHDLQHTPQFEKIMTVLFEKSASNALVVMSELLKHDKNLFDTYCEKVLSNHTYAEIKLLDGIKNLLAEKGD